MNGHRFPAIVALYYKSGNILEVMRRIPGTDMLQLVKLCCVCGAEILICIHNR